WPDDFPLPCAFAVGVTAEGVLAGDEPPARHLLMLDTATARGTGGSGRVFPRDAVKPNEGRRDVLLRGGLDGDNDAGAVRAVKPVGVDASSGLESSPGRKDRERVRRFVEAVRHCEPSPERAR